MLVDYLLKSTGIFFFFFLCRIGGALQKKHPNGATDPGGLWQASDVHGGGPEQLPDVPCHWCALKVCSIHSVPCGSKSVQSRPLWWLCCRWRLASGSTAEDLLQLHPWEVYPVPQVLVLPVRVTMPNAYMLFFLWSIIGFNTTLKSVFRQRLSCSLNSNTFSRT